MKRLLEYFAAMFAFSEAAPMVDQLTREQLKKLIYLSKRKKTRDKLSDFTTPVRIDTKYKYLNRHHVILPAPFTWNEKFIQSLEYFLATDEDRIETRNPFKPPQKNFEQLMQVSTKIGSCKTNLQGGHSTIQTVVSFPLNYTARGYIKAAHHAHPMTLQVPITIAKRVFKLWHAKVHDIIQLPSTIQVLIKRDPVLFEGGIHLITHIEIIEGLSFGVSPWLFECLHMDVDGDTVVILIFSGIDGMYEIKLEFQNPLMRNGEPRIAPTHSHLLSIAYTFCRDIFSIDSFPDKEELYSVVRQKILGLNGEGPLNLFGNPYDHIWLEFVESYISPSEGFRLKDSILYLIKICWLRGIDINPLLMRINNIGCGQATCGIGQTYDCLLTRLLTWFNIKGNEIKLNEQIPRMKRRANSDDCFFTQIHKKDQEKADEFLKNFVENSKKVPINSYLWANASHFLQTLRLLNNRIENDGVEVIQYANRIIPHELVFDKREVQRLWNINSQDWYR